MNSVRTPRAGTLMRQVWESCRLGRSRHETARELGCPLKVVSTTIQNLRRDGYLPRPTRAETRRALRASVSRARGAIGLRIEPYALMGMTPREIALALEIETRQRVAVAQVNRALARARKSGVLPVGQPGDLPDVRCSARLRRDALWRQVRDWLLCRDWARQQGLTLPEGRQAWRTLLNAWHGHLEAVLVLRGAAPAEAAAIVRGDQGAVDAAAAGAFVHEALRRGWLTHDLAVWRDMEALYQRSWRAQSSHFAERAQMEVWLGALRAYHNFDPGPIVAYRRLSESLHLLDAPRGLAAHERFLLVKVFCPWADGEDRKGLYVMRNGLKSYCCTTDSEGSTVFDTLELVLQRWRLRHAGAHPAGPASAPDEKPLAS